MEYWHHYPRRGNHFSLSWLTIVLMCMRKITTLSQMIIPLSYNLMYEHRVDCTDYYFGRTSPIRRSHWMIVFLERSLVNPDCSHFHYYLSCLLTKVRIHIHVIYYMIKILHNVLWSTIKYLFIRDKTFITTLVGGYIVMYKMPWHSPATKHSYKPSQN